MATCYNVYGIYYDSKGQYTQALECAKLSLKYAKKLGLPDDHPHIKTYQEFMKNIKIKSKNA